MKFKIDNFKVIVSDLRDLRLIIEEKLKIKKFEYKIYHKSIDARDKNEIIYNYKLIIDTNEKINFKYVEPYKEEADIITYPKWEGLPPVIVGFGPSGIFAALYLARCGANPIIVERGRMVDERIKDINLFMQKNVFNPESNIAYGEGGAGTFSDGKLTTNLNDPYIRFILNELYLHGADINITYENKPHIGTDVLREVIKNIREEIKSLGGRFYFETLFYDYIEKNDKLIVYIKGEKNNTIETKHLILGLGHFSRDTINMLYQKGFEIIPKAFSMGFRVEHLRTDINKAQYGDFAKYLPSAYYKLQTHHNDRGIYTFCMCPGGYVIPSNAYPKHICINGMSENKRDGANSNSALLVDVRPTDILGDDPLKGIKFQEYYEKKAYEFSNSYKAPANLFKEFLDGSIATSERRIKTSYPFGLAYTDFKGLLPDFVIEEAKYGIIDFDKRLKGFNDPDALILGVESRSSSAIRILRDKNYMAKKMVYVIGEGAGYAGGIVSSALDGLKCGVCINENK